MRSKGCSGATPTQTSTPKPQHRAGLRPPLEGFLPSFFREQSPLQPSWLHRSLSKSHSGHNQDSSACPNPGTCCSWPWAEKPGSTLLWHR